MTASLPTPVSGLLCKLANGATDCFGTLRLAQITADTVQDLGSSLGCGLVQTGADRPGHRAGD